MKKKKLSKQQAMAKRVARLALSELRSVAIVYHTSLSTKKAFAVNVRTLRPVNVNKYHFHAIEKMSHKWSMTLVTVAAQPDGQQNYKVDSMKMAEHYRHTELIGFFNTEHAKMLDSINPKFKKSALWLASLELRDLSGSEIDALFEINT